MSGSVVEMYSIGIGPSSSHTVGPMRAAYLFAECLEEVVFARLRIELFGSLALTGRGHGTDRALMAGLLGMVPESVDPAQVLSLPEADSERVVPLCGGGGRVDFVPSRDLRFRAGKALSYHPNGMRFRAVNARDEVVLEQTWFSIGGGFVVKEGGESASDGPAFWNSARALIEACAVSGESIAGLMWRREAFWRETARTEECLDLIWQVMRQCTATGLKTRGLLPGNLRVRRRAPELVQRLSAVEGKDADPMRAMDWVNVWAIAVNEENAAGGRVVTAPTNGAAGIIPAVMHYCDRFIDNKAPHWHRDFLLTAGAIGLLYKQKASISGADVGCQGEVGVACSMAAAALAALMGATPAQVENAAEIGMEHNLGLTCDPIGGLVQIPCIERNAMGAVKAINAARIAIGGDGRHTVSLDAVIETMRQTGHDMRRKYKETALGGLAANVVIC